MNVVKSAIVNLFLEWPGRRFTLGGWERALRRNGATLQQTLAQLPDSEQNRRVLSHIVGIERWGQRRLQVALGEPPVQDEYNGYRPARERTWTELQADFAETRAQLTALAQQFAKREATADPGPHNDFGPLTISGWLRYLDMHANLEAKKMR